MSDTRTNLMDAITGEYYKYEDMYTTFVKEAKEEKGFIDELFIKEDVVT